MHLLFLPFFLTLLWADATLEHITLNDNDFSIVTEDYDIYDSKGTVMKFYYEARNNDLLHRFNLTLHDQTGTCSAKSIEEGYYEIEGNIITLYTFWDRQGRIYDVPYGARIMRYEVQRDGTLKLLSSRLYIETAKKSFDKESAMRFLWESPKSESDKKAFADYIRNVERQYKGKFVFGDEAKALIRSVQQALDLKMAKRWK
jgi:hypothetical protein